MHARKCSIQLAASGVDFDDGPPDNSSASLAKF